jgi:hypothetical protein
VRSRVEIFLAVSATASLTWLISGRWLIGPARDVWEATIIAMYDDCASWNHHTVEARPEVALHA